METAPSPLVAPALPPLRPTAVRYIKLGAGGEWARSAIGRGELYLDYRHLPHEPCRAGDWAAVGGQLAASGRSPAKVTDALREIRDFYTLDETCLWITFAEGHLWWTQANREVTWNDRDLADRGPRVRRTHGWHQTDILGQPLRTDELSSSLTQVAAYRQTLCAVKAKDYLLQRINAEVSPLVAAAAQARQRLIEVAEALIQELHWADFERLVDLLFARGGWHRSSRLGGTVADVDLILDHPLTGERAFVQVKSQATQAVLDDYVQRSQATQCDRFFFVCHSPRGRLMVPDARQQHLWTGTRLAEVTVKAGLFDWLVTRAQ